MIEYLKILFLHPLAGIVAVALLVGFVSTVLIALGFFRKDVVGFNFSSIDLMPFWDWKYLLFCLFQQFLLVTIFYWLSKILPAHTSLIVSALIFGIIGHFGNRGLMGWCTALALAYLTIWGDFHNIYALWIGHYVLSIFYRNLTPAAYNEGMRVWRR